jgi:YegS/Rv2252/BmrU family lipid kinase
MPAPAAASPARTSSRPEAVPPAATAAALRRRVLIIANPMAGHRGRAGRRLGRVVAALERRGCAVVLRVAGAAGGAERLAREAELGFDIIVAAGGDGTLNAVLNGVSRMDGAPPPVALLPFGTANVFAHDIRLPRGAEPLAELIAHAAPSPIWPGRVDDRLFAGLAGIGFDAEIVARVDPRLKRWVGRLAFVWAAIVSLWRYRPCELAVRVDGAEYCAAAVIAVTGRCYGGPFVIAPRADPCEPILDLLLFRRSGRLAALRYVAALLCGGLSRRRDIECLRCRSAAVMAVAAVPVELDGEPAGATPVALGVAERPLLLIRPDGRFVERC